MHDRTPIPGGNGGAGFEPRRREPVFNIPASLGWVLAALWLIEIVRETILSPAQDNALLVQTAFIPLRYATPFSEQSPAWLWSPLTYSFLHGGFLHLTLNSIWMVAFGAVVARRLGAFRFALFWVFTSVGAALSFLALNWGAPVPVIGASGVVSGLMGGAARFAFPRHGPFRREDAHFLPRVGIIESLQNRTVLAYAIIWFAINFLAAFGFSPGAAGAMVAWQAHIGGFLFGFLFFGLFDHRDWT